MRSSADRKLVSLPTPSGVLPINWLALSVQPVWASAAGRLRDVEAKIADAQRVGLQADVDALQADRLWAETTMVRVTEELHNELSFLLEPTIKSHIRALINALEVTIRWQALVAMDRSTIVNTGFSPSATPYRTMVDAIANCDLRPLLALLIAQAQQDQVVTSTEALTLSSGKQIDPQFPSSKG